MLFSYILINDKKSSKQLRFGYFFLWCFFSISLIILEWKLETKLFAHTIPCRVILFNLFLVSISLALALRDKTFVPLTLKCGRYNKLNSKLVIDKEIVLFHC